MQSKRLSRQSMLFLLPYLYFFLFFFLVSYPTVLDWKILLVMPFALQAFLRLKYVDIILASVVLFLSFWLSLAYLSDFAKIIDFNRKAITFITIGGLIVLSNFAACFLLFRNASILLDRPVTANNHSDYHQVI